MVNLNKISMATLASLALFIYGCGGGGGGGGSNNPAGTAKQSAAASTKAIISALGAATTGSNPQVSKPALKVQAKSNLSDEAQVREALRDFKASLAGRQKTIHSVTTLPSECTTGSGSIDIDDNDTPEDSTDDSFTAVYNNCTIINEGEGFSFTLFQDGAQSLVPTFNGESVAGFTMTFTNYTIRTTGSFGGSESVMDGTISFSGDNVPCNETSFMNGTFTMNFSSTTKMDLDNDGSFEFNQSSSMDSFTMAIAQEFDPESCTEGTTSFNMNGGTTFTDHSNSEESFSATFTNFTMMITPTTKSINGVDMPGDILSMNGTIAVSSDCANGTFTISTPAGQEPFIPEDGSCPVDGRFVITSGGTTTAVIFTFGGGVQVDEGNNGSIDASFPDCESAEVCA